MDPSGHGTSSFSKLGSPNSRLSLRLRYLNVASVNTLIRRSIAVNITALPA